MTYRAEHWNHPLAEQCAEKFVVYIGRVDISDKSVIDRFGRSVCGWNHIPVGSCHADGIAS